MPRQFPLEWPEGRPRTPAHQRKFGRFRRDDRPVTIVGARERLFAELDKLGVATCVISSDIPRKAKGTFDLDRVFRGDPGICCYFDLKGQSFALACDTYTEVSQNLAALAAHIEATRAIERHGVATAQEALRAFQALPPPDPKQPATIKASQPWWLVLRLGEGFLETLEPSVAYACVEATFRQLAKKAHPDTGGSHEAMAELTAARDAALASIKESAA